MLRLFLPISFCHWLGASSVPPPPLSHVTDLGSFHRPTPGFFLLFLKNFLFFFLRRKRSGAASPPPAYRDGMRKKTFMPEDAPRFGRDSRGGWGGRRETSRYFFPIVPILKKKTDRESSVQKGRIRVGRRSSSKPFPCHPYLPTSNNGQKDLRFPAVGSKLFFSLSPFV